MSTHKLEVDIGERFEFGKNWAKFIKYLNEDKIASAEKSLVEMLNITDLKGKTFLDIGSGSGLFSLAAKRLGANVHSFDYDPNSVACTKVLKSSFFPNDPNWKIEEGNVLDNNYLKTLGTFDIVYSWGVLHHTGAMWSAFENLTPLVSKKGKLFLAIYNRQTFATYYWKFVKRLYNKAPSPLKTLMVTFYLLYFVLGLFIADLFRLRNPFKRYSGKGQRGMNMYYDVIDWIGGYPFEVASPEEVFRFFRDHGFKLTELKTCAGKSGCNEFVFFKE
jgi:SAM-dependent methyltransferase